MFIQDEKMTFFKSFSLSLVLLFVTACASSSMMASSALKSNEINLSDYKYAVIYNSAKISFMELELESLMEAHGFKVIGKKDGKKYEKGMVIGTRYTEKNIKSIYGNTIGTTFTISLEDFTSKKTLLTINAEQTHLNRNAVWKQVSQKLSSALKM